MSSGSEEMEAELMQEAMEECRIFAMALRKFRKDCKKFATIAKISQSKTTVHSENLNFRYASHFRYDSEIRYAWRNLSPFDFDPNDFVLYNSHFFPIVIIYFLYFLVFHTSCMAI